MRTYWPHPHPMPAPSNPAFRKSLGSRIKALRKQANLTQKDLAKEVGITPQQLNKYESGLNLPPADMLAKLGKALDATVDYLVTGESPDSQPITNTRLLNRFRALEVMNSDDQQTVMRLIDAMIVQHRALGALAPVDRQTG